MTFDEGWSAEPGPPTDYERTYVPLNRAKPKRSGSTPEAKVSAAIDKYLSLIGAIVIRTNSGSWQDEQGNYIYGAKAGTSDKTVCLPLPAPSEYAQEGRSAAFLALEVKSATGRQNEAQKRYQARVEAIGGLYILARSADDVRQALIAAFGAAVVTQWEAAGKARKRR
jgi:hypothetical protein